MQQLSFPKARECYEDFLNNNYKNDIYTTIIGAYQYLCHPKCPVDKEEALVQFKDELNNRILNNKDYEEIKVYFSLKNYNDFNELIEFIDYNSTYFSTKKIKTLMDKTLPIINHILPSYKLLDSEKTLSAYNCSQSKDLSKLFYNIDKTNEKAKIIEYIREFLLKNNAYDYTVINDLEVHFSNRVYSKIASAISTLDPCDLLDFFDENDISIPLSHIRKIKISDKRMAKVLETASFNSSRIVKDRAKYIYSFVKGNKKEVKEAYYYLKNDAAFTNPTYMTSTYVWIYLNTKFNKSFSMEKLSSLIKHRFIEAKNYFEPEIIVEVDNTAERLEAATKCVVNYINESKTDDITLKLYLKKYNITDYTFNRHLKILQKENPDLYERYLECNNHNSRKSYSIIMKGIRQILDGLFDGIEEKDGTIRKFTILDYYQIFKFPLSYINKLIREDDQFSKAQKEIFNSFCKRNCHVTRVSLNEILKLDIYADYSTDKNGKIILGRKITDEEKESVFNYLKENKIPITMITFNLAKDLVLSKDRDPNKR